MNKKLEKINLIQIYSGQMTIPVVLVSKTHKTNVNWGASPNISMHPSGKRKQLIGSDIYNVPIA